MVEAKPVEILLPDLHDGQRAAHEQARRFNVLACGRRWGKTLFGIDRMVHPMLRGEPVGWFAPTYKVLLDAFEQARSALGPAIDRSSEMEKTIRLKTGGLAEFWTLQDEDAGRSRKYALAVIDEAGMCPTLGRIWHESIRPTLADYRGGAWFLGTPKGRNFFWEAFMRGRSDSEWSSMRMPTATNPHIAAEEIEAARRGMPDRSFRQEFEAEFLEDAGGVFRGVRKVVSDGVERRPLVPGRRCWMGLDLARTADYTVMSVMDATGEQIRLERFSGTGWEEQVARVESLANELGAFIVVDATGVGDPIYERLLARRLHVEPYKLSNQSKARIVDHLAMRIERGQVSLLDSDVQTNELESYEYVQLPGGGVRATAPEGMHDDTVIALALACYGALGQWDGPVESAKPELSRDDVWRLMRMEAYERDVEEYEMSGVRRRGLEPQAPRV